MLEAILAGLYVSLILSWIGVFGKVVIHDRIWERKIKSRLREYRINQILRERRCL